MFTILLTLIGLIVGLVSLFGKGRKAAFERIVKFVIAGVVIDVIIFAVMFIIMICGLA